MKRPALVMWSEGPFCEMALAPRAPRLRPALPARAAIPLERVWEALQPFLTLKKSDVDETFGETLQSGEFDHMEDS